MQYILILSILIQTFAQELISKCPTYFRYEVFKNEENRWYGEILLSSEYILSGYWVEIQLSNDAELLGIKKKYSVTSHDNRNYLITNTEEKIEPGKTTKIPIFVKYNELEQIPEIVSIYLNGREICPQEFPPPIGISPCPGIFSYNVDQPENSGQWLGTIDLDLEYNLKGIHLEVHFDGKADFVENSNYQIEELGKPNVDYKSPFGIIKTVDNEVYRITNSSFILNSLQKLIIPIFVKYDEIPKIPLVNTILVNGRIICQRNFKGLPIMSQIPQITDLSPAKTATKFQTTEPPTTVKPIPIPDFDEEELEESIDYKCGIKELSDKIIHGNTTSIKEHPWHGAIFRNAQYICGMSLISRKHALSAGHCFYDHSHVLVNQEEFNFRFGIDNLEDKSYESGLLSKLYIHEEYKYPEPRFDIAIIAFSNELPITLKIKPVCLWSGDPAQYYIENTTGVIVGFGETQYSKMSNNLRDARILVVDKETCRRADMQFYGAYLTLNSFCAGNLTAEISSCSGDSGGGVFFKKAGTEIWQIRGITSITKRKDSSCDRNVYAIYTDVARFKDWILNILKKSN